MTKQSVTFRESIKNIINIAKTRFTGVKGYHGNKGLISLTSYEVLTKYI